MLLLKLIIVVFTKMKKYIIIIIFIIFFSGCIKETENKKNDFFIEYPEFLEVIGKAGSPFADEYEKISAIAYIDGIIAKESNKRLTNIYYLKAELLYKLNRYNEALETIINIEDEDYSIATLLIILGREKEAEPYLQKCINKNINGLILSKEQSEERYLNIQALVSFYILSDRNYESIESILNELLIEGIITQKDSETLLQDDFFKNDLQQIKEIFLTSMWPE